MTMREKLKQPGLQIQMGLVFLIIASLSKWFLEDSVKVSAPWADGFVGLLYGISIGLMLLGIWNKGRYN